MITTVAKVAAWTLGFIAAVAAAWLAYRQGERSQFLTDQETCLRAIVDVSAETQRLESYVGYWDSDGRPDAAVDQQRAWNNYGFDCERFIRDDDLSTWENSTQNVSQGAIVAPTAEIAHDLFASVYVWLDTAADQVEACEPMGWLPWQDAEMVHLPYAPAPVD
ncbi:hypothetical protein ACI78T_13180 [Blastococcus sp. SYSU D00922]